LEKNNKVSAYFLFFCSPLFALILGCLNYRASYFKNLVWLACGFFGSTFYLSETRNDAHHYRDLLSSYYQNRDIGLLEFTKYIFSEKSHFEDQFYPLLNYLVSRFTDNFYILYAILGLIYGYFLSRNLDFIIQRVNGKISKNAIWLLILFFFLAPIWNLYNVRFWITVQYFFFFAVRYLYTRDIKYLLTSLLAVMMHFSFIFPCALLVLYHILGNKYWIYLILFVMSLVFVKIDIVDILQFLPKDVGYADSKVVAYTADDYVKTAVKNMDNRIWIVKIRTNMLIYMNLISISILFLFFRKKVVSNEFTKSLFSFGILFFAASAMLMIIPTMDRFVIVSSMFLATLYFLIIQSFSRNRYIKSLSIIYIIPVLLYAIVELRIGLAFISTNTILLNPFLVWFFKPDISLLDIIK
jgi:hypothetical protein